MVTTHLHGCAVIIIPVIVISKCDAYIRKDYSSKVNNKKLTACLFADIGSFLSSMMFGYEIRLHCKKYASKPYWIPYLYSFIF